MNNKKIYFQRFKSLEEKFWEKVEKHDSDGCWVWIGSMKNRYGSMFDGEKCVPAHKLSWRIRHGKYPPEKTMVLHKCDNPLCVNPNHLFIGTQQDNMDDMISKGRHRYPIGEKVHTSKLKESDVIEIRKLSKSLKPSAVSEIFGVSQSAIKHIIKRRSWAWLI